MMRKLEARFVTKLRPWALKNLPTCAWEAKHTRGKPFFDCRELKEDQYWSLRAAASKSGLSYKIPDDSAGFKPFDGFILKKVPAYVVIRYDQGAVGIAIEDWDLKWTRLHWDKALQYSAFMVKL